MPRHHAAQARHRQAAFPVIFQLVRERREHRIDEHGVRNFLGLRVARVQRHPENHHLQADAYLRRGQTGPGEMRHGVAHVRQERLQLGRVDRSTGCACSSSKRIARLLSTSRIICPPPLFIDIKFSHSRCRRLAAIAAGSSIPASRGPVLLLVSPCPLPPPPAHPGFHIRAVGVRAGIAVGRIPASRGPCSLLMPPPPPSLAEEEMQSRRPSTFPPLPAVRLQSPRSQYSSPAVALVGLPPAASPPPVAR